MQLFFTILGVVFLIILLIIAFFGLRFFLQMRKLMKEASAHIAGLPFDYAELLSPSRIKARRIADTPSGDERETYQENVNQWAKDQFQPVGRYAIDDEPYIAFQREGQAWIVLAEECDPGHCWMFALAEPDVYRKLAQGPIDLELRLDDGSAIRRRQDAEPAALLEAAAEFFRDFDGAPIDPNLLAGQIERAHAREFDARNRQGGFTEEQILALLKKGENFDPNDEEAREKLKAAKQLVANSVTEGLQTACLDTFYQTTHLSPAELKRYEDGIHALIEPMTQGQVVSILLESNDCPADLADEAESTRTVNGRELFASLNETLPEPSRFKKIGEAAGPVPASIYARP